MHPTPPWTRFYRITPKYRAHPDHLDQPSIHAVSAVEGLLLCVTTP